MRSSPTTSFPVRTIGAYRGAILQSCGSTEAYTREMSEGHSGGQAKSGSVGSSRDSTWWKRRQKRRQDRKHKRREEESSLREGSDQTHQTMSNASGHGQRDERDQELERLHRLVRDLELEARGWR